MNMIKCPYCKNEFKLKTVNLLTTRELEIIDCIMLGDTNVIIAEKLYLSVRTIEKHRSNLMHKLGVKNVIGLMNYITEEKNIIDRTNELDFNCLDHN